MRIVISTLDPDETEQADLRGGRSPWFAGAIKSDGFCLEQMSAASNRNSEQSARQLHRIGSVGVQLKNDRQIEARSVVLATGYVMPAIIQSAIHTVSSSWAIATTPQPQNIWKEGALIWEDSEDYLYARTTSTGQIIIGGEDSDEIIEPEARDGLMPEKAIVLARRLAALWPPASLDIEFRWSGTFDNTSDGLPLIGPVPGAKGIYVAYGYGGNGITFSFLAAQLIGNLIAGSTSTLAADFALDRDGRSIGR